MRNSRGKLHVRSGHMLIAILTLTIWSMPAASQQPLVLIHGLNSDASTWNVASQRLLQDENVTITTPTLSSLTTYENQASSLLAQINGVPGNAIAIGHSNGGIVARQAAADGRSWSGIITIAGPHGGAPLAANVMNYLLFEDAENMAANVTAPFAFYSQFYPDDWGWELGEYAGYFLWTVAAAMPGIAAAEGYALENTVVPEMEPGYLVQTVNSQANLNREAAVIPPAHRYHIHRGDPIRTVVPRSHRRVVSKRWSRGVYRWRHPVRGGRLLHFLRRLRRPLVPGEAGERISVVRRWR